MSDNNIFTLKEIEICTMYNLKMFLLVITILIIISCIGNLFMPFSQTSMMTCNKVGCSCMEQFTTDKFYSYKDVIYPNYSSYQTTPLTPYNSSESLLFGQANRYIKSTDDGNQPLEYILDVYANLYLLNTNPFGQDTLIVKNIPQSYIVYLKDTKNVLEKKLIGKLEFNSDQIYKLHFVSKSPLDYIKYNAIDIAYITNNTEVPLLTGNFTI